MDIQFYFDSPSVDKQDLGNSGSFAEISHSDIVWSLTKCIVAELDYRFVGYKSMEKG